MFFTQSSFPLHILRDTDVKQTISKSMERKLKISYRRLSVLCMEVTAFNSNRTAWKDSFEGERSIFVSFKLSAKLSSTELSMVIHTKCKLRNIFSFSKIHKIFPHLMFVCPTSFFPSKAIINGYTVQPLEVYLVEV